MGDLLRVRCAHCEQEFLSDDLEKCSACGKVGGMSEVLSATALADLMAQKKQDATLPPPPPPLRMAGEGIPEIIGSLKLGCAGLVCVVIGIALLMSPTFRDDPQKLTLKDAMTGLSAIFVGVVLLGLLAVGFLGGRSSADKDDRSSDKG
jgi:hypothetical protein